MGGEGKIGVGDCRGQGWKSHRKSKERMRNWGCGFVDVKCISLVVLISGYVCQMGPHILILIFEIDKRVLKIFKKML